MLICMLFSACTPTDITAISGNPNLALDVAKGNGAVQRAQNGKTTFRYAFSKSGLDGLVENSAQEDARINYISQFIASEDACSRGWRITDRKEIDANILYEGVCL